MRGSLRKNSFVISFLAGGVLLWIVSSVLAQSPGAITEKQVVDLTRTLRNVLEDNRKLAQQNEEAASRIKDIQAQLEAAQSQSGNSSEDMEKLKSQQERLRQENKRLQEVIERFKSELVQTLSDQRDFSNPDDPDYEGLGVSEKSELVAQKSEDVRQGTLNIYFNLGEEAFNSARYSQAIQYYQKYLDMDPDSDRSQTVRLRLKEAQKKLSSL